MALFLDTTVLIDALRGRSVADHLHSLRGGAESVFTCAVNIDELIRGLRPREHGAAVRLLDGLYVAPLGRGEGERAGEWRREASKRGVTLGQADCLVAAAAISVGARLATGNPKDYPMRGLTVEHWPVGR